MLILTITDIIKNKYDKYEDQQKVLLYNDIHELKKDLDKIRELLKSEYTCLNCEEADKKCSHGYLSLREITGTGFDATNRLVIDGPKDYFFRIVLGDEVATDEKVYEMD
jgi:hypothetical protein